MFDDRIVVESPGNLPGIVRLNNMRQVHFSRNPKIAAYLHEYDYVQEFWEGVDRIYRELEAVGLPGPEYREVAFMLHATVRNVAKAANGANCGANDENGANCGTNNENGANCGTNNENGANCGTNETHNPALMKNELMIYQYIKAHAEATTNMIVEDTGLSLRTVQRYVSTLKEKGYIDNKGSLRKVKWVVLK